LKDDKHIIHFQNKLLTPNDVYQVVNSF